MANSRVFYTADGATSSFAIPFTYIKKQYIEVLVDEVLQQSGYEINGSSLDFDSPPANGLTVLIRRSTEIENRLVDFEGASALTEADLDLSNQQLFDVVQEVHDEVEGTVKTNENGQLDAQDKRIVNVAAPVEDDDAARKADLEAYASQFDSELTAAQDAATAAQDAENGANTARMAAEAAADEAQAIVGGGSVPESQSEGNLLVSDDAGGYDETTPSAARTALGLGSASLREMDAHGSANNFPVSNGSKWEATSAAGARTALGLGSAATEAAGTDPNNVLKLDGSGKVPVSALPAGKIAALIEQKEIAGVDGGSLTSGQWNTRSLNTLTDPASVVSNLSNGEFTLPSGSYLLQWSAMGRETQMHQTRIYNVSDGSITAVGQVAQTGGGDYDCTASLGYAVVTLPSSKTLRLEHRPNLTRNGDGGGKGVPWGESIHASVLIVPLN